MNVSTPTPRRWSIWLGGIALGLVAASVGLAAAEVVAALSSELQSPMLDVGDRVVDGVPNSVKELAIEWFGTNDKIALLAGIATLLTIYAAIVGIAATSTRRWQLAVVGIALFGLIGAYASQTTRRDAAWWAVMPSLVGGGAAAATLIYLRGRFARLFISDDDEPQESAGTTESADRRRFVYQVAGAGAGAVAVGFGARTLATRSNVDSERRQLALPSADTANPANGPTDSLDPASPGPIPDDVILDIDGIEPFVTPNENFYRIDTALTVPQISVNDWQLRITGMVDSPMTLTFDELRQRPAIEREITMTCVSNQVGGQLAGHARWLGFRLDDLLAEAGIQDDADQIVGRSEDGYTCGFPVAALDGRDAMVAIGMNGEALPTEHGYPARLIVPGLYGYVSATKWLTEIELTRFDQFDQYWVERDWVAEAPIKLQSRIDTPDGLATVSAGRVPVAGSAWAQTRGIEGVQIQIDDGEWLDCDLAEELNDVSWRQWSYAWDATPGRHSLRVRAIERGGAIQTAERSEPFPSGATGRHQIIVNVE